MDVSNLLSQEASRNPRNIQTSLGRQEPNHHHQYPTRHSSTPNQADLRYTTPPAASHQNDGSAGGATPYNMSPKNATPKNVAFELVFDGATNCRARLPMRVQIFPHDTTDSIIVTVKNFYGLYDGAAKGVSFEDDQGSTLIARYENFKNNMVVHVRVVPDDSQLPEPPGQLAHQPGSPSKVSHIGDALDMPPPQPAQILHYGQPPSRPGSRVSRKQSSSPRLGRGQKNRSQSGVKSRGSSAPGNREDNNSDALNGYSSSDGGAGSVTGSRKARSEQLASAEISTDNIVEGGRRKRAKFESSELPLFVPPQVPAPNSVSSISPQRRLNGQDGPLPFARPTQRTFSFPQPLPSPQSYSYNDQFQAVIPQTISPFTVPSAPQHGHRLRDRNNYPSISTRSSSGMARAYGAGILPTPDPTIASCISDEDVALQLMRLGDTSNISHGRTSASTLDDALSGRADIASSASNESDSESDATEPSGLQQGTVRYKIEPNNNLKNKNRVDENLPKYKGTTPGYEPEGDFDRGEKKDGSFKNEQDFASGELGQAFTAKSARSKAGNNNLHKTHANGPSKFNKVSKKVAGSGKKLKTSLSGIQSTPANSVPALSRKASSTSSLNFQHQLGVDEEDLSSKPRCQRCRKSKKGCDRQRPCQRCKDAGIGIEGCVSEDEGNGRKGRFGRHMGVPVKKGDSLVPENESETAGAILTDMARGAESQDKSKKRKR